MLLATHLLALQVVIICVVLVGVTGGVTHEEDGAHDEGQHPSVPVDHAPAQAFRST